LPGTSAGAMLGLILATEDDSAQLLPVMTELWERFTELTLRSGPGLSPEPLWRPFFLYAGKLRDYLGRKELLGAKTLADLKKQVVVCSFELDVHDHEAGTRKWRPKMFHNFQRPDNGDLYESAVDVALRSSAAPIFFPINDGYIDGGVFANHRRWRRLPSFVTTGASTQRKTHPRRRTISTV
jgi:patatin-like phospholipase/acyl hydrolase